LPLLLLLLQSLQGLQGTRLQVPHTSQDRHRALWDEAGSVRPPLPLLPLVQRLHVRLLLGELLRLQVRLPLLVLLLLHLLLVLREHQLLLVQSLLLLKLLLLLQG
jgi:hypothetical protein